MTLGAGTPEAAALKVAVDPATATAATGWVVMTGADSTFKVTARDVVVPAEFAKVASNLKPFLFEEATKRYVGDVAPAIAVHLLPFEDSFH
jgi:hypothetical protein